MDQKVLFRNHIGNKPRDSHDNAAKYPVNALIELSRQNIIDAIEQTGGNRNVTANLLGKSRSTLYRKMKESDLI